MKILIIRFSSFGDIVQTLGTLSSLKAYFPTAEIHFATRSDQEKFVAASPLVDVIHSFDKSTGLKGLLTFARELKRNKFSHIYDAHFSLRSKMLLAFMGVWWSRTKVIQKKKSRISRFLAFKLGMKEFENPDTTFLNFLKPLKEWGVLPKLPIIQKWSFSFDEEALLSKFSLKEKEFICFAPSAAWEMKRWPLSYWKELVQESSFSTILIMGGPEDTFCDELEKLAPARVTNLAGKLSLEESCAIVSKAKLLVSADTGLLHVADLIAVPAFALIGPTAYGRPTNKHVKIFEVDLPCRPCTKDGRGGCSQEVYQRCMLEIRPQQLLESFTDFY